MSNFKTLLHKIKAFAFDVDGVFTDGQVFLFPGNEFIRAVNIKDGYAVQHCIKMGYRVAIISGGSSNEVVQRFQKLGVSDIYMNSSNKWNDYQNYRMKYGFGHENILYMGDDLPDYEIMQNVGIPACPADAVPEILGMALYVSDKNGGHGCVRDVIEQVLRLNNKWMVKESFTW